MKIISAQYLYDNLIMSIKIDYTRVFFTCIIAVLTYAAYNGDGVRTAYNTIWGFLILNYLITKPIITNIGWVTRLAFHAIFAIFCTFCLTQTEPYKVVALLSIIIGFETLNYFDSFKTYLKLREREERKLRKAMGSLRDNDNV